MAQHIPPAAATPNARVDRQHVVCILGMHRSGTSLLARILNLLGVELGPDDALTTEPVAANPKGYWEHTELTTISDAILKRHGGTWDEPPWLVPGWEASAALDDLRLRAGQLIQNHFAKAEMWGWKDPRSCLTLPFWQQLLANMRYVICLRNPVDVAHSLAQRDGLSIEKSAWLWLTYVSAALKYSDGKPRVVVFYEDLMEAPIKELPRLAEFLGKPERANETLVHDAVAGFIEKGLQHHRSGFSEEGAMSAIELGARALYLSQRIAVTFSRKASDGQQEFASQIQEAIEQLGQCSAQASGEASRFSDREASAQMIVKQLEGQILTLQTQADATRTRIRELSTQASELQKIKQTLSWRILNRLGRF
jgi:hypothetical protein